MLPASKDDKGLIVDMLFHSFNDNKSVNYIIRQDRHRAKRLKAVLDYSFDLCYRFGEIYLSDNRQACALLLKPEKKKTTPWLLLRDARLAVATLGWRNTIKAMKREASIKKLHPQQPFYYLWFIGVAPAQQKKGTGSRLLRELINYAATQQQPIYLETSTLANVPWYEKSGFIQYAELDFGYRLVCMKRESS
jgi:ribosomal protein S18 acetylase RimI-like enzyme